jgi:uncharacterized membrane protein YphA (DoxX/SURF4 family)
MATIVMLVILRLNIGWHFYSEGTKHLTDASWSSEGFLRQAKGPLAPQFQAVLPDYHDFEQSVHGELDPAAAAPQWTNTVSDAWSAYRGQFSEHYKLTDEQRAQADKLLHRRQELLTEWRDEHQDEIANHVHEWQRLEKARREPSADDVPYQKKRIAEKLAGLKGEAAGWPAQVKSLEREFKNDLAELLTPEQQDLGPPSESKTRLKQIDLTMTYGILGIGICLMLGLFTRLASVLGAMFLLSVVLTQPFWVSDASPTFNQFVEMFALLTLATTAVGRWGGLDFFIHSLLGSCCRGKGQTNELNA